MLEGINSKVVMDSRQGGLYFHDTYSLKKSASSVQFNYYNPDSLSSAGAQWSTVIPPAGRSSLIDRRWYVRVTAQFTLVGNTQTLGDPLIPLDKRYPHNSVAGNVYPVGARMNTQWIGLRALPLNSCIGNTNLSLNNASMSSNTNQFSTVLPYTYTRDMYDVYNMVVTSDTYQTIPQFVNNNNNPMASYGQSAYQQSRGDADYELLPNPPGIDISLQGSFTVRWWEPILIPGVFQFNSQTHGGALTGINNINLQLTFTDLSNLLEIANWGVRPLVGILVPVPPTVQSAAFVGDDGVQLQIQYLNPSIALPPVQLPQVYNYTSFYTLTKNISGNLSPGAVNQTVTSNNIQLSTTPSMVLCYVGKTIGSKGNAAIYNYTDSVCPIDSISVQYGGISGLFANASSYQLYQISQQNGVGLSYFQWSDTVGSPLLLSFSRDIPSTTFDAVGSANSANFVITVNFHDSCPAAISFPDNGATVNNPNTTAYSLYTIFIYDEVLTIGEFQTITTNNFNKSLVLQDLASGKVDTSVLDFDQMNAPSAIGTGSFWSSIGNFIKKHPTLTKLVADGLLQGIGALGSIPAAALGPAGPIGVELATQGSIAGLNALIDKYVGQGYSHAQIRQKLMKEYPVHVIDAALAQGAALEGGRRVPKHMLKRRKY